MFRQHPQEGRIVVKERYWPSGQTYYYDETKHQDNWVLCGHTFKKGLLVKNFFPQMSNFHSRKFVKIQGKRNPFDSDHSYRALRKILISAYPVSFTEHLNFTNLKIPFALCARAILILSLN